MKSQFLNLFMICLALTLCLMSCDKSTDQLEESGSPLSTPTLDDFDFDPSAVEEYPSTLIATVQKDGHEIKFSTTGPPESQGIFMEEYLYGSALADEEEFMTNSSEESTPFDVFVAVTDKEVPVPKAIAASAKDNQLEISGRLVQETSRTLNLLDENYTEPETEEVEVRNCYPPGLACYPSYSWNLASCDSYTRSSNSAANSYRGGWKKVRKISARVAHTCGGINLYFYSWNRSRNQWQLQKSQITTSNRGVFTSSHWVPNLVERRVIFVKRGASPRYRKSTQFTK